MKGKTPLLHKFVCFQMHTKLLKDFRPEAFEFLSEKLPFSETFLKCYFRGSRFSQCQQLSITCCQVSFYANKYVE